jgi:hypothetical protein
MSTDDLQRLISRHLALLRALQGRRLPPVTCLIARLEMGPWARDSRPRHPDPFPVVTPPAMRCPCPRPGGCSPAARAGAVRRAIEGAGYQLLYLPPYSPDLNPIENAFSKLKRLSRSAEERTMDGLGSTIGRLLDRFGPAECRNCFRH